MSIAFFTSYFTFNCYLLDSPQVFFLPLKTGIIPLQLFLRSQVTILINNAGIVSGKPLLDTPDHLIQRTFDVNIISHFWVSLRLPQFITKPDISLKMTKAFLPDMIAASHGHIVTIASMAGLVGMTKLVDYCASKYAAVGFDEALRLELESNGHYNVNMTSVCPYFIKSTGMFDGVQTRSVVNINFEKKSYFLLFQICPDFISNTSCWPNRIGSINERETSLFTRILSNFSIT